MVCYAVVKVEIEGKDKRKVSDMNAWKYMSNTRVLLLAKKDNFACLPADLEKVFATRPGQAIELQFDKPLIGADPAVVKQNLETQGWHIWPDQNAV